jgi:hypothetical protein
MLHSIARGCQSKDSYSSSSPSERRLALRAHKKSVRTVPGRKASPAFRGNQKVLPSSTKSAADFFFAVAVHGGGVNQIDAQFEGRAKHAIENFVGDIGKPDICATKSKGGLRLRSAGRPSQENVSEFSDSQAASGNAPHGKNMCVDSEMGAHNRMTSER